MTKKKKADYSKLTLEKVEETFSDLFWKRMPDGTVKPRPPYCIKLDSGMWEINSGKNIIWTNDAGKKQFDDAMKANAFKIFDNEQQETKEQEGEAHTTAEDTTGPGA